MLRSPMWVRILPFVVFAGLTLIQGRLGEGSRYWVYLAKVLAGAGIIWAVRPMVKEMRWAISWEAVVVGGLTFVLWIGLDPFYPKWGSTQHWNPHDYFGSGTALAWLFIAVRIIGSVCIVPPIEELFYRSFLYRYIARPDFDTVPLSHFAWMPFLVTSLFFGLAHFEWLPGILTGMAYQWLVVRKGRLGDAMTAHAITNLLLALWVNFTGTWFYW